MIDGRSGVPAHRQMADDLRRRIVAGELGPGELLPTEAQLGHEYGVGRATVRMAVATLRGEGLVVVERGTGTRVRQPAEREAVRVPRGARVISRMPDPDERSELDVDEGVPVLVVTVGGRDRVYAADRVMLTFA